MLGDNFKNIFFMIIDSNIAFIFFKLHKQILSFYFKAQF